jgi:hypothetical protein
VTAEGPADFGLPAAFPVGVAFLVDERRTSVFFAGFFLAAVFLRAVALVIGGFLRFCLGLAFGFISCRHLEPPQQAIVPAHFTHLKGG